jgi:hypothetical protein
VKLIRSVLLTVLTTAALLLTGFSPQSPSASSSADSDPRLQSAYRFEQDNWIYVHLEGPPRQVGFQHGYLLANEIGNAFNAIKFHDVYRTKRDWDFYRGVARDILWPHIEQEYRDELNGIVEGAKARGVKMDIYDLVALNAFEEVPDYYVPELNKKSHLQNAPHLSAPGNCSAFVATGSYTKDHQVVIAHNNWTSVIPGARWRIVFDIVPEHGNRILMDGFPGVIASDDDFGINSAGIIVTETTIAQFSGFDPSGKPEFVRARKAQQYANSIDDYLRIMLDGNNGGYANDWLLADRKTGEVARFELGLKNHRVWRTKDGYFVGSNFPSDPKLIKEETTFDVNDASSSMNARHARWDQIMAQHKGRIDAKMAQQFLSDHYDTFEKKEEANERTLCGHVETSPRGVKEWDWGPYHPGGTVQAKSADASMVNGNQMSMYARTGHACGADFIKDDFLRKHPEYHWQAPVLTDMKSGPWSLFRSGQKQQAK